MVADPPGMLFSCHGRSFHCRHMQCPSLQQHVLMHYSTMLGQSVGCLTAQTRSSAGYAACES